MNSLSSTSVSKVIKAAPETLYRAFLDPNALVAWLPPGEMTGEIHHFDARVGGEYRMSLYYPASEEVNRGKTSDKEDSFTVRFVELKPAFKIVEAVTFESSDPGLAGEMILTATFEAVGTGTKVTVVCSNIPPGIFAEDNETGSRESLEQLARYIK